MTKKAKNGRIPISSGCIIEFVRRISAAAVIVYVAFSSAAAEERIVDRMTIFVPAAEGSGWGRTGLAIRDALLAEKLVGEIEVVYSPGAGGVIGLAQFIEAKRGDPASILVGGRSILGATAHNRSRVALKDASPVARLTATAIVIATPPSSPLHDLGDLIEAIRIDPTLIKWVGGSSGSMDEFIVFELMTALGAERDDVSFQPVPGGGDEVAVLLSSGRYTVGVSSIEEFAEFAARGELDIIGVSSRRRLPSLPAPTLVEYGVDTSYDDWRGVFAPPGLTDDQRALLFRLFDALARSPSWAERIAEHRWRDAYLPGAQFAAFIDTEAEAIAASVKARPSEAIPLDRLVRILGRQHRWTIAAAAVIGLLLIALALQRIISRRNQIVLQSNLDTAQQETLRISKQLERSLAQATSHINDEFGRWNLSAAEKEIGWMLLKGLSFREIAEVRKTSERTVRQQARSIYAKSGLGNRSDLAAYFLEDFCFTPPAAPVPTVIGAVREDAAHSAP